MICLSGQVDLLLDNGHNKVHINMTPSSAGILVPSGVWGQQCYKGSNSVLLVLCDNPYDKGDYIDNYQEFINWVKGMLYE